MPYLSPIAINNRLHALATTHAAVCTRTPLNATCEGGNVYYYVRIAKGVGTGRPKVLVVGGVHACEWAPPDSLVSFGTRLLTAYKYKAPLWSRAFTDRTSAPPIAYPRRVAMSAEDVKRVLKRLILYLLPCANPDGRAWSMSPGGSLLWRKNRRPDPASGCTGVDINRNFDIAWDFDRYYGVQAALDVHASKEPCSDLYIGGPSAASEPETRNIQGLVTGKGIRYFVDVHSYGRKIYYPWGIEHAQTSDPTQSFSNPAFDRSDSGAGGRDGTQGSAYSEYFPNAAPDRLLKKHRQLAKWMKDAIMRRAGADRRAKARSRYKAGPSIELYPATGASDDFVFSRQILNPALSPMYAFTIECGSEYDGEGAYQPDYGSIYPKVEREVHIALGSLLSHLAAWASP